MDRVSQTFVIDRSFSLLARLSPWLYIAVGLFFLALPVLLYSSLSAVIYWVIGISALCSLPFWFLARYGFRMAKTLPQSSVSVDEEGIWPAHLTREESLIRWKDVHSTKERPAQQRLELQDANGNLLIKLEYQLRGFEMLRAILIERMSSLPQLLTLQNFKRSGLYHSVNIGCIAIVFGLGLYLGPSNPFLGYGVAILVAAFLVHEYLTAVSGLEVLSDRLCLTFPLKKVEVLCSEVEDVGMADLHGHGARQPQLRLIVRGRKKPFTLTSGLGIDTASLYRILVQWKLGS